MRKNPHVRICGGLGSATTLVYPTRKEGGGRAHPRSTREPPAGCSGRQPSTLVRKIGNPSLSAYLGR